MICFSVERPESLENVEAKWIGEVDHYCPDVMIVLVGESAVDLELDSPAGRVEADFREIPLVLMES
jgi:GTPase SAR1 family protein